MTKGKMDEAAAARIQKARGEKVRLDGIDGTPRLAPSSTSKATNL
jgi:hypothetical protein